MSSCIYVYLIYEYCGFRAIKINIQISMPKREEVVEGWIRLHNEELQNFHASPNIIRVIESRRVRWVGHVARMGEMRSA
jgi:hypothetical protein